MATLLSKATHALAARALAGEFGGTMAEAAFALDPPPTTGFGRNQVYAQAARLIAEQAPLRIVPGERVVGAATLLEARWHTVPVLRWPSTSHTTLGFDRALRLGYRGLRQEVETRLARGDVDDAGRDLLLGMLGCLDAATIWHRRYLALLDELIAGSTDGTRTAYQAVRWQLQSVPETPPATFAEAVQALWFMYAFQRLLGNWSGLGRLDVMLGPYLARDLAAGRLDLAEARELLAHLWIKGCEWIDPRHPAGSGDAQFYQNVVLGGIGPDGAEVTNEVTYLVLDVVEELGISDFPIAVRVSARTPERLWRRIAAVQRRGGGIVAVYNEDVAIQALQRFGYGLEEARSFANDGCWELLIPGCTAFGYRPFDVLALLQEVLGVTGDGPPATFSSFMELYAAFQAKLAVTVTAVQREADHAFENGPVAPLVSLFIQDCVERARGYYDRGPRYVVRAPHAGGLPDAVNSLLTIRTLVYEEGALTLPELVRMLRSNWAGHEDLRQRVRSRFAFYGNDDAAADALARQVFNDFVSLVEQEPTTAGVRRPAGISTFGRQIEWAPRRGATAAGSLQGEYLANNLSPAPGTDRRGPTAVIKSFCALDFERLPSGTALDLKVHPSGLQGEAGLQALVALLKTFSQLGGIFLHVDVVDSALLRDAQAHPDRYPNLAVRISGWSARFATLNREWQEMIIQRTEQDAATMAEHPGSGI